MTTYIKVRLRNFLLYNAKTAVISSVSVLSTYAYTSVIIFYVQTCLGNLQHVHKCSRTHRIKSKLPQWRQGPRHTALWACLPLRGLPAMPTSCSEPHSSPSVPRTQWHILSSCLCKCPSPFFPKLLGWLLRTSSKLNCPSDSLAESI